MPWVDRGCINAVRIQMDAFTLRNLCGVPTPRPPRPPTSWQEVQGSCCHLTTMRMLRREGGPNAPRKPGRWRCPRLCDHVTARAEVFGVIQIVRRYLNPHRPHHDRRNDPVWECIWPSRKGCMSVLLFISFGFPPAMGGMLPRQDSMSFIRQPGRADAETVSEEHLHIGRFLPGKSGLHSQQSARDPANVRPMLAPNDRHPW